MEKPGRLQSMGITKSWTQLSDEHFHFSLFKGKVMFMFFFFFFAFGGIIFASVCSKVSALFVTEEAISSLCFFACHLCLKSVSHTWVGLLLDSLFHSVDCMSKLSAASCCLWLS